MTEPKYDPDDETLCNHEWRTMGAMMPLNHICELPKGHEGEHVCATCEWMKEPPPPYPVRPIL